MYYYEVIPATKNFHGKEPLSYSYAKKLSPGQIVNIKLRGSAHLGIVIESIDKPDFETTLIDEVLEDRTLNNKHLSMISWMLEFYPAPIGTIGQLFAPEFLSRIQPSTKKSAKPAENSYDSLPKLTKEQAAAYKLINQRFSPDNRTFIVQGVTGSGKTRLYMELARDSLKAGKSVLVLTPEISLTTPLANQFKKAFSQIIVNHSGLTRTQRLELWDKSFSSDEPSIIIGPRSSLFLPIKDIGLIVVDEFHEPAYKQESQPFYHANRVASMLASIHGAKLIFGSATPPVLDYYLAERKNAPVIKMNNSAITEKAPLVNMLVVNMLDNSEKSPYPLISKTLISYISEALSKGEQSMLFINKRGSARSIACQDCGYRELCENCDLPMVYHGDQHLIRCHTCGSNRKPPTKCPVCSSSNIYFSSPGTKAIAENLSKLFPKAKIIRFDKDNKKSDRLENKYDEASNDADIIVGTQIIAKGHDLPRLSLVSMLLADNGLDFPDYTSAERSYQLIKQLAGRVNRGHREGLFVIQSFNPKSKLIQSAEAGHWEDFYNEEIDQRKKHGFPPFYSALKIESARASAKSAETSLNNLLNRLEPMLKGTEILGPSPSFVEKKASKWHWQVVLKSKKRSNLALISRSIPSSFRVDIDPNNFL